MSAKAALRSFRRRARSLVDVDVRGRSILLSTTVQDLTEQCQGKLEHRPLELRFQAEFESAPFGMSLVSARPESLGHYIRANQAYCEMLGYPQEELLTMAVWSVVHPDDLEHYAEVVQDLSVGRLPFVDWELRVFRRDGAVIWMRQRRSLVRDDAGRPLHFFSYSEDVTQRKAEQAALAEATQRQLHSFENAPIGMGLLSVDPADPGRYLEVNRAACRMLGYPRDQLLQLRSQDITHPDDLADEAQTLQRLVAGDVESYETEKRFIRPDGGVVWCLIQQSLVCDGDGKPLYSIAQAVDVTARKCAEERLRHFVEHDSLTDLLNRLGFERAFKRHLEAARREGRHSALLLIDLDHFKFVNDTLGHAAGDELLRKISVALTRRCRSSDILARLGGDEFALILPVADATAAQRVADELRRIIREGSCLVRDDQGHVTASVGILLLDSAARLTTQEALTAVDIAMYQAKEAGRDRTRLAAATATSQAAMQIQLAWSERLRNALRDNTFVLYQQPILNLSNGTIDRCELLLRLRNGDGTMIAPGAFLPVAEQFGLMHKIDQWVVREAIRFVAAEQQAGRSVQVEVNLSGPSLADASVMACIEGELQRTGVDPSSLVFEVTETVAIGNLAEACRFAQRLSGLGCAFALDDFGAGFSSFYYLKHLPFDYLKIDGDFIRNLTRDAADQQIVKAIVQMAVGLGKKTIAEFVEDKPTMDLLREYGVNFAQGYHVGKPCPLAERHTLPTPGSP
jgi:diguanylate cyclase (GGDEF)-like protein/PAS domain S-box-containing protein